MSSLHVAFVVAFTALPWIMPSQPPSRGTAHRVTVIGCVKRSQPDTAVTGTTVLEPGQTRYVLANISLADDPTQTTTADQIAERVPLYRLADSADALIAPHVGEKVEVTGVIQPDASDRRQEVTPHASARPVLRVERLRLISKTAGLCTP